MALRISTDHKFGQRDRNGFACIFPAATTTRLSFIDRPHSSFCPDSPRWGITSCREKHRLETAKGKTSVVAVARTLLDRGHCSEQSLDKASNPDKQQLWRALDYFPWQGVSKRFRTGLVLAMHFQSRVQPL